MARKGKSGAVTCENVSVRPDCVSPIHDARPDTEYEGPTGNKLGGTPASFRRHGTRLTGGRSPAKLSPQARAGDLGWLILPDPMTP
jgi:hypothetical protein